jgi:glutathione S-transferase
MNHELTLYTNPMSRGRIARWMLEEVGQPYQTVYLDYGTTMKAPEYLALNPMGKVPTVVHQGRVVTECAAICMYLADAFPRAELAPPVSHPLRADYVRWMLYAAGPVEAAVVNRQLEVKLTARQEATVGYGNFSRVMDVLEGLVAKASPYLLGDTFSALDVYLGSQIVWGVHFGSMEKRPGFEEYAARLQARSASIRARALDDAAMPPKG